MRLYIFSIFLVVAHSCNPKTANPPMLDSGQRSVAVVMDVTDPKTLRLWPNAEKIFQLYNYEVHSDAPYLFTLSFITSLKTNPRYECLLLDSEETEKSNKSDDIQWRKKQILHFYDSVSRVIQRAYVFYDTSASMPYSECWASVTQSLEHLASQQGNYKVLIIYSDLAEKSRTGDAYVEFLHMSITEIRQRLEKERTLNTNLNDIKVIVVYQPRDRDDDARFSKMFSVYKNILEIKGATVTQQSVNTFQKVVNK